MVNRPLTRLEGWPMKLSLFLRERRSMPFAWGRNDCLIFAADGVLAITGFDPAAAWRGYASEEEAQALLKEHGGVAGLIHKGLGCRYHRERLKARRGDVAMMKLTSGVTAGIVDDTGERIAVPLADNNTLVRLPLTAAWRIWSY